MKAVLLAIGCIVCVLGVVFLFQSQIHDGSIIYPTGDEVYFRGVVTGLPNPDSIGASIWQIQVAHIFDDPNNHLVLNQIILVGFVQYPPIGYVDSGIQKDYPVQVYGLFKPNWPSTQGGVSLNGKTYSMKIWAEPV